MKSVKTVSRSETIRLSLVLVALLLLCCGMVWGIGTPSPVAAQSTGKDGHMTDEDAVAIGEQFGLIVGEVDKEIQEILGLTRAQGVVVFEVIGGSQADRAGIKVRAVIKEIDKIEVRNLQDFGSAMKQLLDSCNYTIGTYEPADAENQGVGGIMNFHFVPCATD